MNHNDLGTEETGEMERCLNHELEFLFGKEDVLDALDESDQMIEDPITRHQLR